MEHLLENWDFYSPYFYYPMQYRIGTGYDQIVGILNNEQELKDFFRD